MVISSIGHSQQARSDSEMASSRPISESTITRSTCATRTARATHQFEIVGYSLKRCLAAGEFVRSSAFAACGYRWSVRVYPGGFGPAHREFVSVFVDDDQQGQGGGAVRPPADRPRHRAAPLGVPGGAASGVRLLRQAQEVQGQAGHPRVHAAARPRVVGVRPRRPPHRRVRHRRRRRQRRRRRHGGRGVPPRRRAGAGPVEAPRRAAGAGGRRGRGRHVRRQGATLRRPPDRARHALAGVHGIAVRVDEGAPRAADRRRRHGAGGVRRAPPLRLQRHAGAPRRPRGRRVQGDGAAAAGGGRPVRHGQAQGDLRAHPLQEPRRQDRRGDARHG
ncbi:hypothetical protein EE612_041938 [Oryza sativa]|nr:hypothetical protein EE612_041938 [Oryza sativa]